MTTRVNLRDAAPTSYKAMLALAAEVREHADTAGVEGSVVDLVQIRVSQLNGCGYCLRLHTREALENGETQDRLAVLPAWRDTQMFTARERRALDIAETVTMIRDHRGEAATHGFDTQASDVLTGPQVAAVAWVAIVMNSFNRIAISSSYPVEAE